MTTGNTDYTSAYQYSITDPEGFWLNQAQHIHWFKSPEQGLTKDEKGFYRWFADGQLNTAYLALDHHIEAGRGDQTALIYDSPVTGTKQTYTFVELRDAVAQLAGALQRDGVVKGDTVLIYMPMIPQAAIAMLACARIGAIHSVVFGGFAAHELAIRIDDARPKVVLSASCGIEIQRVIPYKPILDKAIEEATHKPHRVVIWQREQENAQLDQSIDIEWNTYQEGTEPAVCAVMQGTDPLYILYTSGTTGRPKGIIREHGGHAVALKYSMDKVYDVEPGETFWAASDVGWVVGHSYIVYAPLIHGCATVLFEGKPIKTPDAGTFWRVIAEHKVRVMFTAPTAIRAIKKEDPEGKLLQQYDLSHLKYQFLAGERCDVTTLQWTEKMLQVPVIDHWWQTESGWPMVANMMGYVPHRVKSGSATKPVCGYNLQILRADGTPADPGEEGFVAIKLPLPPGCLPTLWGNDDRFRDGYLAKFPGYYFSGDGGYCDDEGYVYITGRVDDIINVAGHRLSTAEMEEAVASHPSVAECAVIGIADDLKGQVPIALVVLKPDSQHTVSELESEMVQRVRDQVGPVASLKKVAAVPRLPKTRSGKVLRKVLRAIADGEPYTVPSTIDDPAILEEIQDAMRSHAIGNAYIIDEQ